MRVGEPAVIAHVQQDDLSEFAAVPLLLDYLDRRCRVPPGRCVQPQVRHAVSELVGRPLMTESPTAVTRTDAPAPGDGLSASALDQVA